MELSHRPLAPHMCTPHYQHPPPDGTCFTIDEPILTYLYHSEPIVYVIVHSWYCTFYSIGCMCTSIHPHHYNITQNSLITSLKTSVVQGMKVQHGEHSNSVTFFLC